jgi:hypothetical protein
LTPAALLVAVAFAAVLQHPASAGDDLESRVQRLVHCLEGKWELMGSSGTDLDRIHRWRKLNDTITVQARTFPTDQDAEQHVRAMVAALGMPVSERVKAASFGVRIAWGDGGSSVYLAIGRTAVIISVPSTDLARRLSRQAAAEFSS